MDSVYSFLNVIADFFIKFKIYLIAFVLGCLALTVSLLFGRRSTELKDTKIIKDIVMKDKKDILNEAIKNSEKITDNANSNIIYIEDKVKKTEESIIINEKKIMAEDDVRSISEGFTNAGF